MKEYTNEEIKARLVEDDYPNNDLVLGGVIAKVRNLGPEAKTMFDNWYTASAPIPKFDIEAVTPDYLRERYNMKDAAIILAYDWLTKSPKEASRLIKKGIK